MRARKQHIPLEWGGGGVVAIKIHKRGCTDRGGGFLTSKSIAYIGSHGCFKVNGEVTATKKGVFCMNVRKLEEAARWVHVKGRISSIKICLGRESSSREQIMRREG